MTPAAIVVKLRSNNPHSIYAPPKSIYVGLYITIALIGIAFAAFMILFLWPKLMGSLYTIQKFHSLKALSFSFLLIAILLIPPSIAVAGVAPLPEAKVCSSGGYANLGFLIGQSGNALYFGEYQPGDAGRRRVMSMPLSQAEQLFLGVRAEDARCDKELDTQSFLQAANGLGSDQLAVRISAIYALKRMAETSVGEPYRRSIVRIVASYIREHSPWPPNCDSRSTRKPPDTYKPLEDVDDFLSRSLPTLETRAPDIDAAIVTLAEWELGLRDDVGVLSLETVDLRKAYLISANLQRVFLSGAHLEFADLREANLNDATLIATTLVGANLRGAHLEGTNLLQADLRGADLSDVHIDKRTNFEAVRANADTKWPLDFDAKEAGVNYSEEPVLVCSYFPALPSRPDATEKAPPTSKASS